jgi:hypothetical protein
MGDIFGGGSGGGSDLGDESNSKTKALPSPAAIAAMRAAANSAAGVAGVAKNLPYYAQVASSPGYRQSLQNTANTWSDWMGTAPVDLSQGMAPITQGQFGSVIDAGQMMNDRIASLPPSIQYMLSQWVGPGDITAGSPYDPIKYNPYIEQAQLLKNQKDPTGAGGSGQIGAGGIPISTIPDAPGPSGPGPSGPGPSGPGPSGPGPSGPGPSGPPVLGPGGLQGVYPPSRGGTPGMRGVTPNGQYWKINAKGQVVFYDPPGTQYGQTHDGGRGSEGFAGRGGWGVGSGTGGGPPRGELGGFEGGNPRDIGTVDRGDDMPGMGRLI